MAEVEWAESAETGAHEVFSEIFGQHCFISASKKIIDLWMLFALVIDLLGPQQLYPNNDENKLI